MKKGDAITKLWDMETPSLPGQTKRVSVFRKVGSNLTPWRILKFVFGAMSIALAFGWARYVGVQYVYLPAFPDYLDVSLGVCIGLFLFLDYFKEPTK